MPIFNRITLTKMILTAGLCITLASACQTTENYETTIEVDPSETHIILPVELKKIKGFKITGAKIIERASFHSERVYFTGGLFIYDQYYRGGFYNTTKMQLKKIIANQFKNSNSVDEIKSVNLNIGHTFYTTFQNDDKTCFIMASNQGASVNFQSGTGTTGRTLGVYCENGQIELEGLVMKWLKKVKLR